MQEKKVTDIENNCERVKPAGYPTKRLQKLCEFSSSEKRVRWLPQKGKIEPRHRLSYNPDFRCSDISRYWPKVPVLLSAVSRVNLGEQYLDVS